MKVFDKYARYYDLLYGDKDYEAETDYLTGLIEKFAPGSKSILDLGCGTGRHALSFMKRGFSVFGIDSSAKMVAHAQERFAELESIVTEDANFAVGDIQDLSIDKKFDVAVSLFHVLSYQTSNEDLKAVFKTVRKLLNPHGLFLFDFWYGPTVLTNKPELREKTVEDEMVVVKRTSNPRMLANENCVEVNYDFNIRSELNGEVERFHECHRMRYLFLPEVREFLKQAGMKLVFSYGWMSENIPGIDTWSVCCGAVVGQ